MHPLLLSIISACSPEADIDTTTVIVEAGQYQIGPPKNILPPSYARPRTVTLTYDYAVSKTEVSIGDWIDVTHELPDQFCGDASVTMLTLDHPIRCISWCEALLFANKKSTLNDLDPVYQFREETDKLHHEIDCNERAQFVEMNHAANGWRLPTEAEWEIVSQPDGSIPLQERAWFVTNSNGQPHTVGQKEHNSFGVFDTQGNLHEWIWERFGEFESDEVTDPITYEVPIPSVYTRPIKGGSFASSETAVQPYNRPNASPSMKHHSIGFRLVRTTQYRK